MATKRKGKPIWVADAETDPFKKGRVPVPFIWGCLNIETREYKEFTDTEEFIIFITLQEPLIVYAHNGGKFDWHFITDYIADFEPLTIINGRLAKFEIGDAEFRDSYNIIPSPLSAYQKDDIDYSIFEVEERHKPENWEKIRAYLKSDCEYLADMIEAFIDEYGMNLTQASAAMKMWSKMSGIPKPKTSDFYYEEMSRYYYGGRVQCFETGIIKKHFKVIDIKSAYPYAMTHKHPWGTQFNTLDHFPDYLDDAALGRTFITLDAASMGAFPIRDKTGLQFPDDGEVREFHISGWEYIAARDTNTLANVNVKSCRVYLDEIDFTGYVDHFFDKKQAAEQKGDKIGRLFAKLFLNSLYGKFASNPENYEEFMTLPASMIEGSKVDGWFYCKLLGEDTAVVNRPLDEEKRRYYDVAVSASITGFVRAYLWRAICSVETPLYCDTDSIAYSGVDNNLDFSNNLGAWEVEGQFNYGGIAGKKLYAFQKIPGTFDPKKDKPWKVASKGVKLEPSDIMDIASGATIIYEPEAPTFSIKRGSVIFTPRTIKMTK